jgi:hypothetical protein
MKMKKYITVLTLALSMTACVSDDINKDPNSAYTTVPGTLVSYAQKELSDYVNTPSVNENNFRLTMQYWQEVTYVSESNYNFTNRNVSNQIYSDNFVNVLTNLNQARKLVEVYVPTTTEATTWPVVKKNQLLIIDMMQVYTYQMLVDTFGNIPYSQSVNLDKYPLPAYDSASAIYADLIARINTDIAGLDTTGKSFGKYDTYYLGDVSKWKLFGNSLKLKLGIAIADSDATLAQKTAQDAIAAGVITTKANSCLLNYLAASPNYNPLYENLKASNRNDYFAGKTLVDKMKDEATDPRIAKYYKPLPDGSYKGQVIGKGGIYANFSAIGAFAYNATEPGILLNNTEVAFYIAEANARWAPASAAAAYNAAVTASFDQWGLPAANATTYLAANPYDAANWKKSIGEQAWVAMYNQPLTSYNFYRRLDFPILLAPPTAIVDAAGKVPVRMMYPVLEQQVNTTNWQAASTAIGGDLFTTKLFWDKF